jgi:hypothetical protein
MRTRFCVALEAVLANESNLRRAGVYVRPGVFEHGSDVGPGRRGAHISEGPAHLLQRLSVLPQAPRLLQEAHEQEQEQKEIIMKVKTTIRAGGFPINHNRRLLRVK